MPESGSRAYSQERETIPGWCSIAKASSGRASSLEKIFDYVEPVCSVFISYTPTGIVLNCHCPKTHEIEMNCAFLCTLTVKYFIPLQSYSRAFGSTGWHQTSLRLDILAAFCMPYHWFFFLWPRLHGYRLSMLWLISKCTYDPSKSQAAARMHRIHRGVCLCVCFTACEMHTCVGRGLCEQFRCVANITQKLLSNKVILPIKFARYGFNLEFVSWVFIRPNWKRNWLSLLHVGQVHR